MIKRHYFMSVRKPHDDGSGSYSFNYVHFTMRSWLPDSVEAFNRCQKQCEKALSDRPGSLPLEVVAFNRC